MALPVIAAAATRVAAVSGRAAVGAGRAAGGASRATRMKSQLRQAQRLHAQMQQMQDVSQTQDLTQQAVKKSIPKMALFVTNGIAGGLELGTGGIAFLLTFFVRLFTLGWYNFEMIFGGLIMKGKHPIVGPLTWDPIPMPFEKKGKGDNSLGLVLLVIMADLFVILGLMIGVTILILPFYAISNIF